ncbi:MAG: haloalkane dehalogenase [Chloroflexi bacterium]|nr:haloalkane dehalogenase [Chloroflexota bacterium]
MAGKPLVTDDKQISAAFPFESKFIEVEGSKIHYVEEGTGDPILFLHGNPTSSYLWRNIIPYAAKVGRAIAPDLIGMGKSDKPDIEYRFFDHVPYIEGFIEQLGLQNITLVIHDWGSGLGFHYASRHEDNIKGVAFMEAILPMRWDTFPEQGRDMFKSFRTKDVGEDLLINKNVFVENVLPGFVVRTLTDEEMDHYREPYKDEAARKPVWRWPNELPIDGEPADVWEAAVAYQEWLQRTEVPKILFHATPGALVTAAVVESFRSTLKNLKTVDIGSGAHFVQEDNPHKIGEELAKWYQGL